jgi:hypothetical protein
VTQFVIRFNLTFVAPLNKCGNNDEKPIAHGHVACGLQRGVGIGGNKAYGCAGRILKNERWAKELTDISRWIS